ncbi:hypothetical protein [Microcoleus sp. N3A4]|uniref:hypothetical protein n=1 Tax=Microcoleus sp. N3A4 TaxID=3055379 RepID=UPI002FCEFD2F
MSGKQQRQRLNILDSQTPVIRTTKYLYEHLGGCGDIKQRQQLKFSRVFWRQSTLIVESCW